MLVDRECTLGKHDFNFVTVREQLHALSVLFLGFSDMTGVEVEVSQPPKQLNTLGEAFQLAPVPSDVAVLVL